MSQYITLEKPLRSDNDLSNLNRMRMHVHDSNSCAKHVLKWTNGARAHVQIRMKHMLSHVRMGQACVCAGTQYWSTVHAFEQHDVFEIDSDRERVRKSCILYRNSTLVRVIEAQVRRVPLLPLQSEVAVRKEREEQHQCSNAQADQHPVQRCKKLTEQSSLKHCFTYNEICGTRWTQPASHQC